jgi:hypothetical protein
MANGGAALIAMRTFLAIVLSCTAVRLAAAQQPVVGPEGQTGVVYSDSTSFWIEVPRGWVLDAEAGRRDGEIAVLYRQGESWGTGDPVMYATLITPKSGFNAVVPAAVRTDSARWAGQVPDLVFSARDSVRTVSDAVAYVREYASAAARRYDTVAYMQADARVWMLVLTARSLASHDAALADFVALVRSYAPGAVRRE